MQSAVGKLSLDEGQGGAGASVMPGLCLRKLVCMMFQAVAGRNGGWGGVDGGVPVAAAFSHICHTPAPDGSCRVGLPSPFTLTDEGAECQPAGSSAGAQSLLLWGRLVAGGKGTCAWGLRTISLKTPLVLG